MIAEDLIGRNSEMLRALGTPEAAEVADALEALRVEPSEYLSVRFGRAQSALTARHLTLINAWPPGVIAIEGPFTRYLIVSDDGRAACMTTLDEVEEWVAAPHRVPCPTARERLAEELDR